ncbi:Na+/H+ antiporter subunit E [Actinomadura welshii]|uniref:Na+/H+ antiporter subunit E n=1 Tax=Actinomadura welshii TaxID=3103817 RepID=UPI0003ACE7B2|nr:Na+/H+ antiporter subunit E [Actinomadura madurae]
MNDALRGLGSRLGMAVWLLAVWLLLWGRIDALTVIGGIAAVAVAYGVSRLPTVPLVTRVRPLRFAEAALEFAWDLVASSVVIGWHAVRAPRRVRGAIVEVSARSRSELVLLAVTMSISLRPGTLLVDLDWERSILRVHAMPVRDRDEADAARDGVLGTEHRLVRAFGTPEDEEER